MKKRMSPLRRLTVGRPLRKPKRPGEMNGLEKDYSEELTRQGRNWLYERIALILSHGSKGRKGVRYLPDFAVYGLGGLEFHEVKGFKRTAGVNKLKLAAEMFPGLDFFLVTWKDGEWLLEEY